MCSPRRWNSCVWRPHSFPVIWKERLSSGRKSRRLMLSSKRPVPELMPLMSRYSSNLPSARPGVRFPLGFWISPKRACSISPWRFHPPSFVWVSVWADASPGSTRRASAARRKRAILICCMGAPLARQPEAGRVVGAVDGHVTVVARAPHHELLLGPDRAVRPRHVAGFRVALLAKPRLGQLQHGIVVGPVRVVTVRAALHHRLVAPEERTALLRMAGEARVVQRRLLEQGRRHRAVWAMARATRHLAFAHRHVRGAHGLGALLQVAGAAGLDLVLAGELVLLADVVHEGVAVGAGHVAGLVAAALPEDAFALRVAVEAHLVTLQNGGGIVLREGDETPDPLASTRFHVGLSRAVTVFAGVLLVDVAGLVEEETAHACLGELVPRLLVAALAGLRPHVIVGARRRSSGGRLGRLLGDDQRLGLLSGGRRRQAEQEANRERSEGEADHQKQVPAVVGHGHLQELLFPEIGHHGADQESQGENEQWLAHEHEQGEKDGRGVDHDEEGKEIEEQREHDGDLKAAPGDATLAHRIAAFFCSGCTGPWQVMQDTDPSIRLRMSSFGWPSEFRNFCDSPWHSRHRRLG